MEGPKPLWRHERASLERLVDNTFTPGRPGAMFGYFPTFFGPDNDENHFVYVDNGNVVAHGGMLMRWASLAGCTVRVGMVGAVAVDSAYRGRNLAWECMEATYAKARREGVDYMLISGGRTLYLRAGARRVGRRYLTRLNAQTAAALVRPGVTVVPAGEEHIQACRDAYERKRTRFVRVAEDWSEYVRTHFACCTSTELYALLRDGLFAGYLVATHPKEDATRPSPYIEVLEYAGEPSAVAVGLGLLTQQRQLQSIDLYVQEENRILRSVCECAGAVVETKAAEGTILVLNFEQLTRRLHPLFEARMGVAAAGKLRFQERNGEFVFTNGDHTSATDRGGAAEWLFGSETNPAPDFLSDCLPVPTLSYGVNYV